MLDVPPSVTPDRTSLHGWVIAEGTSIVDVVVKVDGLHRPARFGIERPDVAAVHGDDAAARFSGYDVAVDLWPFEGRTIDVEAEALLADGSVVAFGRVTTMCVALSVHRLHAVERDVPAGVGFVAMNGIALMDEPVARVVIERDGRPMGRARLNAFGTPTLARSSSPSSAMAGFDVIVDIRGCAPGSTHEVAAVAEGVSGAVGERSVVEFTVTDDGWGPDEEAVLDTAMDPRSRSGDDAEITRVLVATHHLGLGGAQLYLQELLRRLARGAYEFLILADVDGLLRSELEAMGASVRITGHAPFGDPVAYEVHARGISALVDEFDPHIVLANTLQCFPAVDVGVRRGVPSVFVIHESFPLDEWFVAARGNFAFHPHVRAAARSAIAGANRVVFEAEATRAMFTDLIDEDRSMLVRYGIETGPLLEYDAATDVTELRRSIDIDEEALVFLCIGVYEPRKAQSMLATAFALALERNPDAVLLLVGAQGDPYSDAVKRHVDELGCGDRIRVMPVVRDLRPWYALSDVLVSASDIESMPRSMMEAMAFGLPVLAASATGVDELVTDGETGWLVATRDLAAMREGITRAADAGPAARRAMGEAARRKVIADHQSDGYGSAFDRLLEELRRS